MVTRLDAIEARRAMLMPLNKWTVNGLTESMSLEDSPTAKDLDVLLAVARVAVEFVDAERAWNEADMLVGNSQEDWENVHAAYDMAVERSKAAMKALDAVVASLLMQEVTE